MNHMKIEEITETGITKVDTGMLHTLRLRSKQFYEKYIQLEKGSSFIDIDWDVFFEKYQYLVNEFIIREIAFTKWEMDTVLKGRKGKEIIFEELEKLDIQKPFTNEHSCRVHDPKELNEPWGRNTTTINGKTVSRIYGSTEGHPVLQAYRYKIGTWTADQAKVHCGSVEGSFEAALNKTEFSYAAIEKNIKIPQEQHKELFENLQSLANVSNKIKKEETIDEWNADIIKATFAKIVDSLRSVYFPVLTPKIGSEYYKTSYGKLFRASKKLMKSKQPKENVIKLWDIKRTEVIPEEIEKRIIPIFDISKAEDEHVICGIVYEPNRDHPDTDGDFTTKDEILKASNDFMERVRKYKIMHKFDTDKVILLQNVVAPTEFTMKGRKILKGTWYQILRIKDMDVWKKIKSGEYTGLSMAGSALV